MSLLAETLYDAAEREPHRVALRDNAVGVTYGELYDQVGAVAGAMQALELHALGLLADNGLNWAVTDLAAYTVGLPLVPLPLFFSPQQMLHVIRDAGLDSLLTDRPKQVLTLLREGGVACQPSGELAGLQLIRMVPGRRHCLPPGTLKITYTSGTTGAPKGVCLPRAQIEAVAASLRDASQATASDRHLCLTPLSTLLENIGGLYVPLLAQASVTLPGLREVGLRGAAELDVAAMVGAMRASDATSVIMAPQMLRALVAARVAGADLPPRLRFVAVGGAPVSLQLLEQANRLGIPVFEGYGLSECASVVALNKPGAHRPGSVGRPLPHVSLSFAEDGEILVENPGFLGYLGQEAPQRPWPTGDLGYLDADGYLHLTGRKKNMFITAFGRNVAPEWVERELTNHPAVLQAAVFGEARPFNTAVVVVHPSFDDEAVDAAIMLANQNLPDYARVTRWVRASQPFSLNSGQLTANGRLRYDAILASYAASIDQLYREETHDVF